MNLREEGNQHKANKGNQHQVNKVNLENKGNAYRGRRQPTSGNHHQVNIRSTNTKKIKAMNVREEGNQHQTK